MLYPDRARALALKALTKGGHLRTTRDGKAFHRHVEWNAAKNCAAPVTVEHHSRPSHKRYKFVVLPVDGKHMTTTMEVPCRKCEPCLKRRAAHWRLRAMAETSQAARTWFCTFTFTPAQHARFTDLARRACAINGDDFDALPEAERFALRHGEASKELTLFLKRLRKNTGAPITYLLVCEAHKSGLPHYHALVHETSKDQPIRHSKLSDCWKGGHANFKLVADIRAAGYLTKYLSKSALARVRASGAYGEGNEMTERERSRSIVPKAREPLTPPLLSITSNDSDNEVTEKEGMD